MSPRGVPRRLALPALALLLVTPAASQAALLESGQPYGGTIPQLPATIQAEAYNVAPKGRNGISFNYNGEIKQTPYRTSPDSIGLAAFGKGHVSTTGEAQNPDSVYIGWTHEGEWFKYTLNVTEPGKYLIGGKFASADKGTKVSFTFGQKTTTGPLEIPTTAGKQPGVEPYHVWQTLDNLAEIELGNGITVLTVKIESGAGINFDYFTITKK